MTLRYLARLSLIAVAAVLATSPVTAQLAGTWETNLGVPGVPGNVFATATAPDGTVYVAGDFSEAGDSDASGIAMWDGAAWQPLGEGLTTESGTPIGYALTVGPDGYLYVGGRFDNAGGVEANNLARWDGESWHSVGGGLTDAPFLQTPIVRAVTFDSSANLYVSGIFLTAGDQAATNVARWDGESWHALGQGTNQSTLAIAADSNDLVYFAGRFTQAGGMPASGIAVWDGEEWSPLGSGLTLPFLTGAAFALAIDAADRVYVGGAITAAGGEPAVNIARWDGESWSPVGAGLEGGTVLALEYDATRNLVYAGGRFTGSGDVELNRVAAWNGEAWWPLGEGVNADDSPVVYAFELDRSEETSSLVVAGAFEMAGGSNALGVARWVPTPVSTETGSDATALALLSYPNPASAEATVSFSIPEAQTVRLAVYDMLGREVLVLVDAQRVGGSHDVRFDTGALAPGMYLVRLSSGTQSTSTRLTVVR